MFGAKLYRLFQRAGLGAPQRRLGAPLSRADDDDILAYAVETWRSIVPLAERVGSIPVNWLTWKHLCSVYATKPRTRRRSSQCPH